MSFLLKRNLPQVLSADLEREFPSRKSTRKQLPKAETRRLWDMGHHGTLWRPTKWDSHVAILIYIELVV